MITSLLVTASLLQTFAPSFTVQNSLVHAPAELRSSFWAGYARNDAGDWVVEIYARQSQGRGEYVLRRSLNTPEGREQATWTTSEDCPVALNVIRSLDDLSLGGLAAAPRLGPAPQPFFMFPPWKPVNPDTPGYVIWGRGRQPDGALSTFQVTASNGLVAEFIEQAEAALRPCWKEALED